MHVSSSLSIMIAIIITNNKALILTKFDWISFLRLAVNVAAIWSKSNHHLQTEIFSFYNNKIK